MALRPVFLPNANRPWVRREVVSFTWYPGLAASQKQKSIAALHEGAHVSLRVTRVLEISSKSLQCEGVAASAFNLKLEMPSGFATTVECAYQGSKKFATGGPYTDIYRRSSLEAKHDDRLRHPKSRLVGFSYCGEEWALLPPSLFYDWLYLTALGQPHNRTLLTALSQYEAFTDIEFNPEKSISCQAASAALFVGLCQAGHDLSQVLNPSVFRGLFAGDAGAVSGGQARLF